MTDTQQLLSEVDLFQGLSSRELKRVVRAAREVTHSAGREVAEEGKGAIGFHLILTGTATVATGSTVRRTLGPGQYFGEISMIDGQPRSATVTADTELTTLVISHTAFESLIEDEPAFAKALLVLLCARLRAVEAG